MAIDKTGSTENIDSYNRVREPLSPQQNPKQLFRVFLFHPVRKVNFRELGRN